MTTETQWRITWETGPDAGERWHFADGRHVVGRATQANIRCDDSALQPFHVQLDLDGDALLVRQLAGRLPVRVQSVAAPDDSSPGSWRVLLGNSVLHVERAAPPSTGHAPRHGAGEQAVVRAPRHLEVWAPQAVHAQPEPAAPTAPSGGLAPVIAALVATLVMALVLRQMMFVVFGAVGTMVAAFTFVAARLSHRRRFHDHACAAAAEQVRVGEALDRQQADWAAYIRRTVPTLHEATASVTGSGVHAGCLWQRRPVDGDATRVSLGMGAVPWSPVIDRPIQPDDVRSRVSENHDLDVPVAVDLCAGSRLAISGPHAMALANSMVLQLSILTGPADWQLVVVTTSPACWSWTRHLPHARTALGQHLMVDEPALLELIRDGSLTGRHTVVVTDQPALLTVRTSALRRLEAAHDSLALIVVHHGAVPAMCRASVVTLADGRARHIADVAHDPHAIVLRLAGAAAASADRRARHLSDRRDPEDDRLNGLDIATTVGLGALLNEAGIDIADAGSIAAGWRRAGPDPAPRTAIGRARDGVIEIDLVRDGPHALLAGTTGAGKSELLRSLVLGLSCALSPEHLTFVMVDYKGGAAFDELAALPHVVGTVTDLDHQLAERALRSLQAELTVRERLLREHGVSDLTALRARAGAPVMPRILVVVDEFAALATEQPDFLHALVGIAQRGRSLGVHLLLATQRPSGVISDDIRANTNLRIALRLHDTADAVDVVGDPLPASLPRSLPGRAVMRLGPDELITFQTAHATEVASIVEVLRAAAELAATREPRQVWCDPLPARIDASELGRVAEGVAAVGLIDQPDQQMQSGFHWRPTDGGVLVVGSAGSGVTSTLVTLASTLLNGPGELFVIDGGSDAQWDGIAADPMCIGVVRLHERERLWRLLHRVAQQRSAAATRYLVLDGLGALRHELDALDRSAELELLDRIVADTSVVMLVGADRAAAVPAAIAARCAVRLVLHLHDHHEGASLGVPSAAVPPRIAGRAVIAATGTFVQMIAPQPLRIIGRRRRRVVGIATLPMEISSADLPSPNHDRNVWHVPVGVGFQELTPAVLEIADGEHALIAGTARSGRSTLLVQLCLGWLASSAEAQVVAIAGRRSPMPSRLRDIDGVVVHDRIETALDDVQAAIAAGLHVLLAVDDAEMVDDPSGRLATMITGRAHGLTVVAAGRPDALRQTYGHWTLAVRRSRLGLLSSDAQDVDGDLLGATVPRRPMLAHRAGLFHLVDGGRVELVQLASPGGRAEVQVARVS